MKKLLTALLIGGASLLISCGSAENTRKPAIQEVAPQDSSSYELVVFDGGFESWFQKNRKPSWYHTESYYKTWNRRYVDRWNAYVRTGKPGFDTEINYDPSIDYGLEVEHKLYYYFKYTGFD